MATPRLTEFYDHEGNLTHQMCCICFKITPIEDLWKDSEGYKWDLCSVECANRAGAE